MVIILNMYMGTFYGHNLWFKSIMIMIKIYHDHFVWSIEGMHCQKLYNSVPFSGKFVLILNIDNLLCYLEWISSIGAAAAGVGEGVSSVDCYTSLPDPALLEVAAICNGLEWTNIHY